MQPKLKVGWFSFTCCEDSSIVLSEILNDYFFEWKKRIDFVYFRILKSSERIENLDIAFVEGAISSPSQEEELKKIRRNSKKLIAIGSCAVTGRPSGARNDFSLAALKKMEKVFKTFQYSKKVKKLDEVVKVDDFIPGCPMRAEDFIFKMKQLSGGRI